MSEQDRERFGFFFDQPLDGDVEFICFRCPIESASKILAECERRCLERGVVQWESNQDRALLFQIPDHPCTVAITRDMPWEVARLSKLLNTTIATFGYGGMMIRGEFLDVIRVFAEGRCIETYRVGPDDSEDRIEYQDDKVWPLDSDEGKPFDVRIVKEGIGFEYRSERRKFDVELLKKRGEMFDDITKHYGLFFPNASMIKRVKEARADDKTFARIDTLRIPKRNELSDADYQLKFAIQSREPDRVRAALKCKPSLISIVGTGRNPIQFAVENAHVAPESTAEIVRLLGQTGAPSDEWNMFMDASPFLKLFDLDDLDGPWNLPILQVLVELGAYINRADLVLGWSCLHHAAKKGKLALVQFLHAQSANMSILNRGGETPKELAKKELAYYETQTQPKYVARLKAVIEYLSGAEQGLHSEDWLATARKSLQEMRTSRRNIAFKLNQESGDVKNLCLALRRGDFVDDATLRDKALSIVRSSYSNAITIEKAKADQVLNEKDQQSVEQLNAFGFAKVGQFILSDRDTPVTIFLDPDRSTFACLAPSTEDGLQLDFLRFHNDGTTLEITSRDSREDHAFFDPDHPRGVSGWTYEVEHLIWVLDDMPVPACGGAKLHQSEFAERLFRYLEQERNFRFKMMENGAR